ncbi:hypothetical protein GCM10017714_12390 [Curtobacterium pusillum]|uniref:Uncharacterized protein n=1 Tax=Curtobacterium pusillum TaxID=69373 RepID=A0AAW3T4Z5_9MICO|nr:hypothetical protein [Curtobacterium pusillum]MBA8990005.1 hypothetical protein [Curtobacterium pusillum]GLK30499.1 hypothetical protein GCM10017610_07840 [Curtobacterium pusillum]
MTPQNDELSSHRTRTNFRPDVPATTASTAVLDASDAQQTQED